MKVLSTYFFHNLGVLCCSKKLFLKMFYVHAGYDSMYWGSHGHFLHLFTILTLEEEIGVVEAKA